MADCAAPVGEQTVNEIFSCSWNVARDSFGAVVDHPGGANITQWIVVILIALIVLMFISGLFRRPYAPP